MGQAATLRGKSEHIQASGSAFGPKGRAIRSNKIKGLRLALLNVAKSVDKDARAFAVGENLIASGEDVATCLSLARSALRADSASARARQADRAAVLQAWEERTGKDLVARAQAVVPSVDMKSVQPIPMPKGALFLAHGYDPDSVASSASWAHASKASNLSTSLKDAWSAMHKTLLEEECQPCVSTVESPSPCWEAGMCICSVQGQKLKRLCNRFKAAMKVAFPVNSKEKGLLVDGSIVARVHGSWVVDDFEAMLQMTEFERTIYLHIGLMYLSPYRPTMLVVEPAPDLAETSASPHRMYVKASIMGTWRVFLLTTFGVHVALSLPLMGNVAANHGYISG